MSYLGLTTAQCLEYKTIDLGTGGGRMAVCVRWEKERTSFGLPPPDPAPAGGLARLVVPGVLGLIAWTAWKGG